MVNKLLLMKKRGLVPGATAYWDCTQVVGQVLPDLSGNGNHGQLGSTVGVDTNDPTPTAQGIWCRGDDYALLPGGCPAIGTIVAVFHCPVAITAATTGRYLVGTSFSSNGYTGIAFGTATGGLSNEVITILSDGVTGRYGWCADGAQISAGWHVLVVTWTGSAWTMHLDGVSLPLTSAGAHTAIGVATTAKIGARSDGDTALNGETVGAIRIHTFALSAAQREQERAYFRAKFAPLGVVLP